MPDVAEFEGQIAFRHGQRTADADADVELVDTDEVVLVSSAGGSAGTLSADLSAGKKVTVIMTAFDTNAYTLAVTGGTLTLNAAGEIAEVYSTGSALYATNLQGATVV